jgi:hypothetical protein
MNIGLKKLLREVASTFCGAQLSITADVLKKKVSECDRGDSLSCCPLTHGAHSIFVFEVGAWPGQFHRPELDPAPLGLSFHQNALDRVHRHAVRVGVKGGEESGYLDVRLLPEKVQRPGAVFAAAPR